MHSGHSTQCYYVVISVFHTSALWELTIELEHVKSAELKKGTIRELFFHEPAMEQTYSVFSVPSHIWGDGVYFFGHTPLADKWEGISPLT